MLASDNFCLAGQIATTSTAMAFRIDFLSLARRADF